MTVSEHFAQNGYFTQPFEQLAALNKIRNLCVSMAKEEFGSAFTELSAYHHLDLSAEQHDAFQFKLFSKLNELQFHHQLVKDNLPFFTELLGPDIDVQTQLYLRIARPGISNDNIGMHRDTDYGNSAYEISVSFPLVDQPPGCGLNIVPGSHLFDAPEIEQFNREDVERGSNKNKMGFLYAPKKLLGLDESTFKSISLPYGHALGFSLGVIHGQKANESEVTRWNIDFRVKNSFHPLNENLKAGYYSSLTKSVIRSLAEQYYQKNTEEVPHLLAQSPR